MSGVFSVVLPPAETDCFHSDIDLVLPYRHMPRPPSGVTVQRKDLLRQLTEASLLKQASIVRGPAGSGKTTLLSQWRDVCQQMGRPLAWLTINGADREPAHFIAGLAAALDQAGCKAMAEGFRGVAQDSHMRLPVQMAQHLASVSNRADEKVIIVLDQYEEMDGPVAGEIMDGLLQHSANMRFLIATRIRPGIALGSLRAHDQLFEIAPSRLNLTPWETRTIFSEDVPELYTRRLHFETSGEAVAIGFARRVMDERPRDIMSSDSWLAALYDYYRDETLKTLPTDLRMAMSRLVVVESFDLSLATALIGGNATEVIERLHHTNSLLLRHRGIEEFYFPEALRRFLKSRLVELEEEESQVLQRRAAMWFVSQNRHAEALRHALAAGDQGLARELLDRVGYPSLVAQYGVSGAHRLLDSLCLDEGEPSLATLFSLALIHAHERDVGSAITLMTQARLRMAKLQDVNPEVQGDRIVAEAFVAGLRDETIKADTSPALEGYLAALPQNDHDRRAQVYILLSWDRYCRGDIAGAEALTDSAAMEYAETEGVYGYLFMHVHRALARFWRNNLGGALDDIVLAERMTRIFFPDDRRLRLMTGVLRAGILVESGRPDPLIDLTAAVGTLAAIEGWSDIQIWAHVYSARAAIDQGQIDEARAILSHGLEISRQLDLYRFTWNVQLAEIDLALRVGEVEQAKQKAEALGVIDASFLEFPDCGLIWQDRIGGVLIGMRVAEGCGDLGQAEKLATIANGLAQKTSAARFSVEIRLALGRIAHRCGDVEAASVHAQAAREACGGTLTVGLFREGGSYLKTVMPDLQARIGSEAPMEPPLLPREVVPRDVPFIHTRERDPLTARERQILLCTGEGLPSKITAHRLQLSEATVKFHLRNAYRKLQAQNRTQALARYRMLVDQ